MEIILCCAAGMSTSLLVSRMEEAAKQQRIKVKIKAVSADLINEYFNDADVILLGPQVRYLLTEMKKKGDEKGVPVNVIDSVDYGRVNGENVLRFALGLIENK